MPGTRPGMTGEDRSRLRERFGTASVIVRHAVRGIVRHRARRVQSDAPRDVRAVYERRRYVYFDVPENIYRDFLAAPSQGEFFNLEIRDRYRYRELK